MARGIGQTEPGAFGPGAWKPGCRDRRVPQRPVPTGNPTVPGCPGVQGPALGQEGASGDTCHTGEERATGRSHGRDSSVHSSGCPIRVGRPVLMPDPVHIAFLGCGFIAGVHCTHLRQLGSDVVTSFASRDPARAERYRQRYGGVASHAGYEAALADPQVDAVVVAVPPRFHLDLTLRALEAGKHVLVEKPAFPTLADYEAVRQARDRAGRVVLVGENDHYKPLAVTLRALLADDVVGDLVFANFTTIAHRLKPADDWRNDETMAGGDAFFEEGIHWLHVAGSLGPRIVRAHGYRPVVEADGADRRAKSLLVALQYDTGAVGTLYYSREIPSLLRGLRVSKLFGRRGVITFESNGGFVIARRQGNLPRVILPGVRDIRGYQAMYRDFVTAIRTGRPPEMRLERAIEDQHLMEQIVASARDTPPPSGRR